MCIADAVDRPLQQAHFIVNIEHKSELADTDVTVHNRDREVAIETCRNRRKENENAANNSSIKYVRDEILSSTKNEIKTSVDTRKITRLIYIPKVTL